MPSNSFKASQLIAHLKVLMEHHGDLDVVLPRRGDDRVYAITEKDIVPATSFSGRALPNMVYAIEPRDPVLDYQVDATDEPGGWNYDLSQAPEDMPLKVYKRQGGADTHDDLGTLAQ